MSSADVTHSFLVPRLAGENGCDSEPDQYDAGSIRRCRDSTFGQCAQYRGTQHAKMLLCVMASRRRRTSRGGLSSRRERRIAWTSQGILQRRRGGQFLCIARASTATQLQGTGRNRTFWARPDTSRKQGNDRLRGRLRNTPANLREVGWGGSKRDETGRADAFDAFERSRSGCDYGLHDNASLTLRDLAKREEGTATWRMRIQYSKRSIRFPE